MIQLTLRKQRYRQTNGQTTRAELIRHSGRAGGTKTLFADFKKNENDAINQLLPTEFQGQNGNVITNEIQKFHKIATLLFMNYQLTFTCSKLTIETLEEGVKYVQI